MKRNFKNWLFLILIVSLLGSIVVPAIILKDSKEANAHFDEKSAEGVPYGLFIPASYEGEAMPLVIVAGNAKSDMTLGFINSSAQDKTPSIVVNVAEGISAEDLENVVDEVRSEVVIDDTKVYGVALDGASSITALDEKIENLFAKVTVVDKRDLSEKEIFDTVAAAVNGERGLIYNGAVKNQGATSTSAAPVIDAIDGSMDTVWAPTESGEKNITIKFNQKILVSRWQVVAKEAVASMKLQLSYDGVNWVDVDVIKNNKHARVDRVLPTTEAQYVRFVTSENSFQIAEFEVYAEFDVSRDFSSEKYTSPTGMVMPYRLFIPQNYDLLDKVPVVVFLHGSGQRGTDNNQQMGITKAEGSVLWALPEVQAKHPSIVVVPQIGDEQLWRDEDVMDAMEAVLKELESNYSKIDTDRIYGTGLSIGAEGLFNMAIKNPDLYAALLPVAGGPNNPVGGGPAVEETVIPNIEKIANIPIWEMQAYDDSVREHSLTNKMINAYRELGYNPRYTVYLPGETMKVATSSHSSWIYAYEDNRIVDWLFAQNKQKRVKQAVVAYTPVEDLKADEFAKLGTDGKNFVDLDTLAKPAK